MSEDKVKVTGLEVEKKTSFAVQPSSYDLFAEGDGICCTVLAAVSDKDKMKAPDGLPPSATDPSGHQVRYSHSVNVDAVYKLKDISTHHSACIQAKKYASVGLGFVDSGDEVSKAESEEEAIAVAESLLTGQAYVRSKVDDVLDPLTYFGFNHELLNIAEDFEDTGTGYMECVRNSNGDIARLGQVSVADLWPVTEGSKLYYYYRNPSGQSGDKYFALFGDKDWMLSDGPYKNQNMDPSKISEIIPFLSPSNRTKYQGYPEWMAGSTDIDLLKKAKQYKADFYHNRGVLDYIVSVSGPMDDTQFDTLKTAIQQSSMEGRNFGNVLVNVPLESKLQVDRMAPDMKTEDQFAKDNETLTQNIVSAHRVPPLLANILIPGKLGASNEFINALVGFQLLVIGPKQNIYQSTLARTLGGPIGVKGLEADDFRLRSITSQIDIAGMDTVGRMRSEALSGENADRDMGDGVKD